MWNLIIYCLKSIYLLHFYINTFVLIPSITVKDHVSNDSAIFMTTINNAG